jgi:LacI family transcriptional regulator/LacI family purine nucleotide synthesis repressor
VIYDDEDSIYQAANYLIAKGHRALGLSIHNDVCFPEHPHVRGFSRALSEAGINRNDAWLWANCCYEDAGACLAEKYLALPAKSRPTGICIINDTSASSFINHVTRSGVRVPQDVSVVGHDDTSVAKHCLVPLTTISHSVDDVTNHIMQLLLSRMEDNYDGPPRKIVVRGQVVERESVSIH